MFKKTSKSIYMWTIPDPVSYSITSTIMTQKTQDSDDPQPAGKGDIQMEYYSD